MEKIIRTWWWDQPGNFGDIITPYIVDALTDYTCEFNAQLRRENPANPLDLVNRVLIGTGSTAQWGNGAHVIWGSGMMKPKCIFNPHPDGIFLSVRGPKTMEILRDHHGITVPEIYGDPALLMPRVYNPEKNVNYDYGLFGHYNDTKRLRELYGEEASVLIIDPLNPDPLKVIDELVQCDKIISSSLHGIIIAHAYGIPATWSFHGGNIDGDGTKYRDHYAACQLPEPEKVRVIDMPVSEFSTLDYTVDIQIDMDPMLQALQDFLDELTVLRSQ